MEKKHEFDAPGISLVESLTAKLITANRELEEANQKLRLSEQAQADVLANVSHDLRAPLTAIRGALDHLLASEEKLPDMLAILDRRVSALEHLVSELYYATAMEQAGFTLHLEPVPLAFFLEEYYISQKYSGRLEDREARLSISESPETLVMLDTDRMLRVLDNLFSNALKFTQPGDVIELGCYEYSDGRAALYIKDSGPGIAPEDIPHIFERTYLAGSARTPGKNSGSGLGLYIARTLVEKHGGTIGCSSTPDAGTCFTIWLPAHS